ncbi:MAG: hypothetical protein L0332_35025 [Chloroflexi bacterium]|nr:hypothetical protein [Chloroflexota bacterium]MCI0578556.1 hypothetical protein [Chloroflexota bacterium]MCI0645076.1 hypothetical protein [Chloroflexota bacterium]MCI0731911.1 hypothetical protein [Chloroflexota bacterium]
MPGSPAIDIGDPDTCPITDQRGEHRPADGDGDGHAICDIGAFERTEHDPTSVSLTSLGGLTRPAINLTWLGGFILLVLLGVTAARRWQLRGR